MQFELKYKQATSRLIWLKQKVHVDNQLSKEFSNPYCGV